MFELFLDMVVTFLFSFMITVDGGFTEWENLEVCSRTCGGGIQTQKRSCTAPSPANGGKECIGEDSRTVECNTEPCPGLWSFCFALLMYL